MAIDAPVTPATPPQQIKALPNAPKVEISATSIGQGAELAAPPKKGSARESMFKELESRAKQDPTPEEDAPAKPAASKKVDEKSAVKPAVKADEKPADIEGDEPASVPTAGEKPADDGKKPKVSPWKLVEEYKSKLAAAEARVLETEKRAIPEDKWKSTQETLASKEKRLAELEEEIRYVDYAKSDEFKTKYQQPYEKAWQRAMGELGELTIEGADGNARAMAATDLLELVNLPLGKAHELAVEKFGDLAGEVMAHRKELRNLFDQQSAALEDARKNGVEHHKALTEKQQREFGEMSTSIKETWSKANSEITTDEKYGSYFTPKEGDEQGNQRLSKGFELADRAFSENPMAPGLTPEQRAGIVKRHAAVRNRAAAFGRLVYLNTQAESRIAALEKELSEYKGSEPGTEGSRPEKASATGSGGAKESMIQALRKRAVQR